MQVLYAHLQLTPILIYEGGYSKVTGVHIDDIYQKRKPLKYPSKWIKDQQDNDDFRREVLPELLSQPVYK